MQVRALLLVALIGANAGLLGSRAGDALVRRSERTIATRLDHRGDGAPPPASHLGRGHLPDLPSRLGQELRQDGQEQPRRPALDALQTQRRPDRRRGSIVVYHNSPGDGIARSAVVFGTGPTEATGDEGVELDRAEIWNFGQVPTGTLAKPARHHARARLQELRLRPGHQRVQGSRRRFASAV